MLVRASALATLASALVFLLVPSHAFPQALVVGRNTTPFEYVSPLPDSRLVPPATTIALREGETLDPASIHSNLFNVVGSSSGARPGSTVLSDDQKTVIFRPEQPFALGETVEVTVNPGIQTVSGRVLDQANWNFTIYPRQAPLPPLAPAPSAGTPTAVAPARPSLPAPAPRLEPSTLPPDLPAFGVNAGETGTDEGDLFLASFSFPQGTNNYLLILDPSGQVVYYKKADHTIADFKKQPNGLLTYYEDGTFYALNNSYQVVNTFTAGNGYGADLHELQLLPNGHALLMIYDAEYVDMSAVVSGGNPDAIVTGLVLQELDSAKNVVFQWRSWDHFAISDTYEDMTQPTVDYVHGNAIDLDGDGNILLSSRHLSEITKINRETGDVMWRWGGKHNQFTFVDVDEQPPFYYQHDVRRLPNGDITLFDNRTALTPLHSDTLEFKLDQINKTATLVWQYRHSPDLYALAMGNVQLLPNGNRLIDWGTAGVITELNPDNTIAFELALPSPDATYRAFRFLWQATPQDPPVLVGEMGAGSIKLTFSWNGATDVDSYRVYGGPGPNPTRLLATQPRTGFDTQVVLPYDPAQCFYYQVRAVDAQGNGMATSNAITTCH